MSPIERFNIQWPFLGGSFIRDSNCIHSPFLSNDKKFHVLIDSMVDSLVKILLQISTAASSSSIFLACRFFCFPFASGRQTLCGWSSLPAVRG